MTRIHYSSERTQEGDGAEVKRLFPVPGRLMNYDPFVLWDDFTIRPGAGFPTHPHRGFEAITYLFSGTMLHEDNLGNVSTVGAGGAQRFTAGAGIEHSEMPGGDCETRGIQLWINLPRRLKGIAPDYQEVPSADIPQHDIDGGHARTIVGNSSPLRLHTDVRYLEIVLAARHDYFDALPAEYRGFIYLVSGSAAVGENPLHAGDACFLEPGSDWRVYTTTDCRLMVCTGRPHREPIRQHGSFVD
jgi:redox-sensitive bicupin YhaK (pirin superfamily)